MVSSRDGFCSFFMTDTQQTLKPSEKKLNLENKCHFKTIFSIYEHHNTAVFFLAFLVAYFLALLLSLSLFLPF